MFKSTIVRRKAALFQISGIVLITLILLYISYGVIRSKGLTLFCLMLCISPLVFINDLMKGYRRSASVILEKDSFSIVVKKMTEGAKGKAFTYALKDLQSYTIRFPGRRSSSIVFNFRSGRKAEYSFFNSKKKNEETNTKVLMEAFDRLISDYNGGQTEEGKIVFMP